MSGGGTEPREGRNVVVRCPGCGPVTVDVTTVEVHRNPRDGFALWTFPCPVCGEFAVGGDRVELVRLEAAGARRRELRSTTDPPICHDDVLAMHEFLATDPPLPTGPPGHRPGWHRQQGGARA